MVFEIENITLQNIPNTDKQSYFPVISTETSCNNIQD